MKGLARPGDVAERVTRKQWIPCILVADHGVADHERVRSE
jgi:hypothetical protein